MNGTFQLPPRKENKINERHEWEDKLRRRKNKSTAEAIKELYIEVWGGSSDAESMTSWAHMRGLVNVREAYYARRHL